MNKFCIVFAWCIWSSKTPISNYLSPKIGLPIFNNDAIRSEVIEDKWFLDTKEHLKRRNLRIKEILKSWIPFIADISIDREWISFKEKLSLYGYKRFIISINLSKDLLIKLYKSKWYNESLKLIDQLLQDHKNFIKNYWNDIGINIDDNEFDSRLKIAYDWTIKWLQDSNLKKPLLFKKIRKNRKLDKKL